MCAQDIEIAMCALELVVLMLFLPTSEERVECTHHEFDTFENADENCCW